jgi:hypothetical protein
MGNAQYVQSFKKAKVTADIMSEGGFSRRPTTLRKTTRRRRSLLYSGHLKSRGWKGACTTYPISGASLYYGLSSFTPSSTLGRLGWR